jgi:hypothetical protein
MVAILLTKMLFILFFVSCLIVLRHGFLFVSNFINSEPKKYGLTPIQLTYLAVAIGIIITDIIKGIGL